MNDIGDKPTDNLTTSVLQKFITEFQQSHYALEICTNDLKRVWANRTFREYFGRLLQDDTENSDSLTNRLVPLKSSTQKHDESDVFAYILDEQEYLDISTNASMKAEVCFLQPENESPNARYFTMRSEKVPLGDEQQAFIVNRFLDVTKFERQRRPLEQVTRSAERVVKMLYTGPSGPRRFPERALAYREHIAENGTISGDLFWARKLGHQYVVVFGDASGHGPVASMIRIALGICLERIETRLVNRQLSFNALDILKEINEEYSSRYHRNPLSSAYMLTDWQKQVFQSLQEVEPDSSRKNETKYDGADACVVVINPSENLLEYAHGGMPVYFANHTAEVVRFGQKSSPFGARGVKNVGNPKWREVQNTYEVLNLKLSDFSWMFAVTDGVVDRRIGNTKKDYRSDTLISVLERSIREPGATPELVLSEAVDDWSQSCADPHSLYGTSLKDDALFLAIDLSQL